MQSLRLLEQDASEGVFKEPVSRALGPVTKEASGINPTVSKVFRRLRQDLEGHSRQCSWQEDTNSHEERNEEPHKNRTTGEIEQLVDRKGVVTAMEVPSSVRIQEDGGPALPVRSHLQVSNRFNSLLEVGLVSDLVEAFPGGVDEGDQQNPISGRGGREESSMLVEELPSRDSGFLHGKEEGINTVAEGEGMNSPNGYGDEVQCLLMIEGNTPGTRKGKEKGDKELVSVIHFGRRGYASRGDKENLSEFGTQSFSDIVQGGKMKMNEDLGTLSALPRRKTRKDYYYLLRPVITRASSKRDRGVILPFKKTAYPYNRAWSSTLRIK